MINYVINLDRRMDRWSEFLERIKTSEELTKDKFIRISAFDGYNHENELKRYNLQNCIFVNFFKHHKSSCKKGEFGVYMSHYITLYNILINPDIKDEDYVGIYEDDFMLSDNFEENYKKFKETDLSELDVDFIYIGGRFSKNFTIEGESDMFEKTSNPNVIFRKSVGEGGYNWDRTLHAYVIRKSACKTLLKLISTNFSDNALKLRPIDAVMVSLYSEIKMFDYIPHLYYSEICYKSDIQNNRDLIYF